MTNRDRAIKAAQEAWGAAADFNPAEDAEETGVVIPQESGLKVNFNHRGAWVPAFVFVTNRAMEEVEEE